MVSNRASFIILQVCGVATLGLAGLVVYQRSQGVLQPNFGPRPEHAVYHPDRSLRREKPDNEREKAAKTSALKQ